MKNVTCRKTTLISCFESPWIYTFTLPTCPSFIVEALNFNTGKKGDTLHNLISQHGGKGVPYELVVLAPQQMGRRRQRCAPGQKIRGSGCKSGRGGESGYMGDKGPRAVRWSYMYAIYEIFVLKANCHSMKKLERFIISINSTQTNTLTSLSCKCSYAPTYISRHSMYTMWHVYTLFYKGCYPNSSPFSH